MSNEIIENSVMVEAQGLVNGARAQAYGHPKENFDRICALWNAYLRGRPDPMANINNKDHAILMILVKVARLLESPNHRDSLVDICGYAGTYEKLIVREEAEEAERDALYAALALAMEQEEATKAKVTKLPRARGKCCKHCATFGGIEEPGPCNTPDGHFIPCVNGCNEKDA